MFTITSTRIVGLIAVVCAVVAPQALAATSTHNTVSVPGDPSDVIQRYELRGEVSDRGFAPTAFAAFPLQSPMGQPANNTPGGIVPAHAVDTLLSGNSAVLANDASRSGTQAMFVYMPTNPGWGAAATEAKKSASKAVVKTAPVVCNGQPEYEYVYSGCAG